MRSFTAFNHFDRKLVTHDAWVLKEWVFSFEDMVVGAADPDTTGPHEDLSRAGFPDHTADQLQLCWPGACQYVSYVHRVPMLVAKQPKCGYKGRRWPAPIYLLELVHVVFGNQGGA